MVNINEKGIWTADGNGVGENIIWNSSLRYDHTLWGVNNTWDHTVKDGYPCIHHTGALQTTAYLTPKQTFNTTTDGMLPYNGLILTFSAYVLLEDVVKGTTNYYLALYKSGETIDGTWRNPTVIKNNGYFITATSDALDPAKLNGNGWTHVSCTFKWGDYAWSNTNYRMQIYARDYSGDFYIRDAKIELGEYATPWTPNSADTIYVSDSVGFSEEGDKAKIWSCGSVTGNEFIQF